MAAVFAVFIFYKVYTRNIGLKAADQLLIDYYKAQNIRVISISSLKTADKLKYGVPLNPYVSFYHSPFQIFSALNENYHRCVETTDVSGKEHIRYVELCSKVGKDIEVKEFDTYEF